MDFIPRPLATLLYVLIIQNATISGVEDDPNVAGIYRGTWGKPCLNQCINQLFQARQYPA